MATATIGIKKIIFLSYNVAIFVFINIFYLIKEILKNFGVFWNFHYSLFIINYDGVRSLQSNLGKRSGPKLWTLFTSFLLRNYNLCQLFWVYLLFYIKVFSKKFSLNNRRSYFSAYIFSIKYDSQRNSQHFILYLLFNLLYLQSISADS